MRWEAEFRELISGRARGIWPSTVRSGLALGEPAYAAAIRARNSYYDHVASAVHRLEIPVISVGNLTTGGTGKTPLTAWLGKRFSLRGWRVGLVSRGYGAKQGGRNDEARELELLLPGVPHLQNPDRIAASRLAVARHGCELVILDDGFQHRRLHRDLDIVLIDALAPFGFGRLLPRGLLREPVSSLRRAHVIAVTRADLVSEDARQSIVAEIQNHAPEALVLEVMFRPRSLLDVAGNSGDAGDLRGQRVMAFCGIGNPAGFRPMLENCGAILGGFREYPDHHPYRRGEPRELAQSARAVDASMVVCTMKDFVKVRDEWSSEISLRAIVIDVDWMRSGAEFETRLDALITRR